MEQEQKPMSTPTPAVYTPRQLREKLGKSRFWMYAHAKSIPGARETFPGSGIHVFIKATVDAYYGW